MLSKFSVKKPYTVLVAVVLVIVLGVVSFMKMTTDLLPNISLPYVIVMTTYPGASPETVEMVVTKPVESSMATVSNIEGISSVSSENYSMVILEFSQSADMNAISLEIRENLDQIKSYWDDSVGNPIIMKLNPDMMPVMIAAVGGENMTAAEISELTENTIIPELESIEGVASASATGLLEESVHVVIRQEKIDAINEQVFSSIDVEIDEAKADLQESKQEVTDGQKEVANARTELAQSKLDLETSKTELANSKQEIADGKAELAESKTELENGKTELTNQKEATTAQLAAAETQIITAKADLEAAKMHLTLEISTLEATNEAYKSGLKQAKTGLEQAQSGLEALQTAKTALEGARGLITALDGMEADADLDEAMKMQIAAMTGMDASMITDVDTAKVLLNAVVDGIISNLEAQGITEADLDTKIAEAESGIAEAQTKIAELEATISVNETAISTMKTSLEEINSKISSLDSALTELYKGNLTAAIEFANAQTAISLGETQIATAEAQLDTAEAQLEAGEEQIKAGEEQIISGEEQLKETETQLADALQQILDGEVELEEAREDAYDQADMNGVLTVDTIEALLAAQNFSMPAGYVTEEGISYLIRVGDKPEDLESLKNMPILNLEMDGVDVITLGDVADVFMTDNSADIYANVNGTPGIMVTIQKQTGYSTGEVSDKLLDKLDELMEADENLTLITLMDQGIYIDLIMDSIINNILFGGILAVIILLIFLKDIRPTLVVACSIPISLVTAIICMYFSGVTLNVISLSGLALGIGMLVDNSIVVIENIYRMRREGCSAKEAAIKGAGEVAGAILASTLTTVCVFLPIVFTEGITRQLFVDMGLTIGYSLLASLVVALTVVPAMASKTLTRTKENQDGKIFNAITGFYEKILKLALRFKPVVLLLVVLLLVGSAYASYAKGTAFMPDMDSTQMTINLTMPKDTPLSETGEVSDEMVDLIMTLPEVVDVGAMASTSTMATLTGSGDSATNATVIYVTLSEDKDKTNEEVADELEEMLAEICEREGAEIEIETSTMDMSALGGSGISIQIRGRDIDTLQVLAADIAEIVESVEGTQNVSNGLEESTGELRIIIDRDKAIQHGMTVAEVYQQIATKLASSSSATTLTTEVEEYDVYVKHAGDMELTRQLIRNLEIERTKQDGTKEAILTAGRTRLRPVLMTALTTILALSTMVFSHDMGSEMTKPMSIVTIGGLVYGTLLTLVVIPCIYDIFSREKKDKKGQDILPEIQIEEAGEV